MVRKLDELGVSYGMDVKYGAHDWGVWRDAFTTFAKDYLWDVETDEPEITPTPDTPEDKVDPTTSTSNPSQTTASSVKTGDDQNMMIYGLGLLAGITGLGYVYKKRKVN